MKWSNASLFCYFKVLTPLKYGDIYLYDTKHASTASCSVFGNSTVHSPCTSQSMILPFDSFDADNYDIPRKAVPVAGETKVCIYCSQSECFESKLLILRNDITMPHEN